MEDEGSVRIDSRRHGRLAFLRRKQWWSFEGIDLERRLYYVLLALEAWPVCLVSLKGIDYARNRRWQEERTGRFRAAAGDAVDVTADGRWGTLRFSGDAASGWQVEARTAGFEVHARHVARAPAHRNRLLTRRIDYRILQFAMDSVAGEVHLDGRVVPFAGHGYHEHAFGVQPRHSRANWLHFWTPEMAGVVLDCHYDEGVSHHYTVLFERGRWRTLHSPAQFEFRDDAPDRPWQIRSPDLELVIRPLHAHHTRMRVPPIASWIDIDYRELLVEVTGSATLDGRVVPIEGIGKFDHNFNRW